MRNYKIFLESSGMARKLQNKAVEELVVRN